MAFSISNINILDFPKELDFNNTNDSQIIVHNAKQFAQLETYLKEQSKNKLFEVSINTALVQSVVWINMMFKQLMEMMDKGEEDAKLKLKYKMIVLFYEKIMKSLDVQKILTETAWPIEQLKEDGFIFSEDYIIGTNKHLVGNNGIYIMAFSTNWSNNWWTFVNLTAKKNGNHISDNGGLCAGSILSNLSVLLENQDFEAFFLSLGSILSSHDDRAYHMADKGDFDHWKRMFQNIILGGKKTYEGYEQDWLESYSCIDKKLHQFIKNLQTRWVFKSEKSQWDLQKLKDLVNDIKQSLIEIKPEWVEI